MRAVYPLVSNKLVGKKKGMDLKVHKSTSVKRLKSPPQAVPLRRYMVVDGLGVARAQAIMDERGGVSKDHQILIVL